jgi:hypothetical protein
VAKTVDVIENVFMGMGGPNKRLTTFCACTVEAKGDVSEHFLDRPGWTSVRTARISSWPDGWSDDDSPVRALWDEWNGIRLDGSTDDNIAFYVQHKDTLTKGMTVSWSERFDPSRGEPDALYSAMWAFYDMGEDVFARMMQNDPLIKEPAVFDLTPEIITSRITNRLQGEPVEDAELVIVSTDLNPSYAFSSAVVGFGAGHRAWVIDYWTYRGVSGHGIVSGNVSLEERSTKVYEALVVLGKDIMSRTVTPSRWYIDASGTDFKTVLNFCKNSPALVGIQAVPCTGRVENNGYKPNGSNSKQVGHWAYRSYDKKTREHWLVWHASYWKELAQRAWLGSVGNAGSVNLPKANAVKQHEGFAKQICRESLSGKGEVGGKMIWTWNTQPGEHDYGDVMAQAYAGASWMGYGPVREQTAKPRRPRRPLNVRQRPI